MRQRPFRPTLAAAIAICAISTVPARTQNTVSQDWAQFRGPNATGIARGSKAPPIEFGPAKNVLWKAAVPSGHSSPVLWGNRIFLTAFDAERKQLLVMSLDRTTGKMLWRQEVPFDKLGPVHPVSTPATASPVVDGERVYAYFVQAGIFAFALDGTPAWKLPLPAADVRFGSGTSPVIAGDLLILARDTITDPTILAVDRKAGTIKWQTAREILTKLVPHSSYSTPVVVGDQVIVHGPGTVTAYDAATGEKRWWVLAPSTGTSTPAVVGDMLYVAAWSPFGEADQMTPLPDFAAAVKAYDSDGSGTLSQAEVAASNLKVFARPEVPDVPGATMAVPFAMVDADKSGDASAQEWTGFLAIIGRVTTEHGLLAIKSGGRGDVTATNVIWREKRSVPEVPSPLVYEDRVYYVRNGGVLTCLEAATGRVVYRERLGAPGPYYSSPISAGNRLFIGSGDGALVVFASGDALKVLARNELGEPVFATPAVSSEGTLYVRTPSALYAFAQR
jgi:outer membrane protein assembly factor BamB